MGDVQGRICFGWQKHSHGEPHCQVVGLASSKKLDGRAGCPTCGGVASMLGIFEGTLFFLVENQTENQSHVGDS